jgi:hypothetical protein
VKQFMQQPLVPPRIVAGLIVSGLLLPIALCVVMGVSALLSGMGDAAGGRALQYVAMAGGIVWIINLLCLLLVLAIGTLGGPDDRGTGR